MNEFFQGELDDAFDESEREIKKCFAKVVDLMSNADPEYAREWARDFFREFVKTVKLPPKKHRAKPKRRRDAELLADYTAAARGKRRAVLLDFAQKYNLGRRAKSRAGAMDRTPGLEIAKRIMQRQRLYEREMKERERSAKDVFREFIEK